MTSPLAIVPSAKDFFENEILRISQCHGLQLEKSVLHYLAEVLSKFSSTQELKLMHPSDPHKTLSPTEFWLEVQTLPVAKQLHCFQYLGDYALFTTGFFAENIKRSLIDMDYFQALGGQAYYRAGEIRENIAAERALNVFFNLSDSFQKLSEILSELYDRTLLHDPEQSLKLFERWERTGSQRLARLLVENGFAVKKKTQSS